MRRRLTAFVSHRCGSDVIQFCKLLDSDAETLDQLRAMLTINVSEFFRDPEQFDYLRSDVLPELLKRTRSLRIWSAACAQGQEPYSVAIILAEMSAENRAMILATDLDREAIQRAKAGGPYRPNEVRNVPNWQLRKYFTASDESFMLIEQMRRQVQFRELDLLTDEFKTAFDLIICRNVMIYLSSEAKQRLVRRLHASLKPGGVLFVGGAETMFGDEAVGFGRLSGNFYRSKDVVHAQTGQRQAA